LKPLSSDLSGGLIWKTSLFHLVCNLDECVLRGARGQGSLAVIYFLYQVEHAFDFSGNPKISFQLFRLHG